MFLLFALFEIALNNDRLHANISEDYGTNTQEFQLITAKSKE
jgi:hypothetical protein